MSESPVPKSEFRSDLRASAEVLKKSPILPIVSVFLATLPSLSGSESDAWSFVLFPLFVLALGWYGTERMWFLRAYRGVNLRASEAWRMTRAFVGRFIRLGLLVGLVLIPIFGIALSATRGFPETQDAWTELPFLTVFSIVGVLMEVALTFVTPALAFTTKRARSALRIGLRMLRSEWPQCAWYALTPPLAVTLLWRIVGFQVAGETLGILLTAVGTLLTLWFKGATVAFYMRRMPVGENGAAFEDDPRVGSSDPWASPG